MSLKPWVAASKRRTSFVPTAYDTLVLSDTPVGYWSPSTTYAADLTGNGRNGSVTGTLTSATMPGSADTAPVFDGASYLEVADADAFSVTTTGVLTVEAWMRPDVVEFANSEGTGYVHWMGKGESGQQEWVSRMYSLTNSESRPNRTSGYAFSLAGGLGTGSYFQDAVSAGSWIHYTLVINTVNTGGAYPHGYVKLYKNGVQRDQDDLHATAAVTPGNGTAPLRIGTRDLASFFQGAIGKVAIYDYELPQPRILAHYRQLVTPPSGTGQFVRTIGTAKAETAGTTLVIPVTTTVPVGNTIIIRAVHDYTVGGPTATDSKSNTYTRDRSAATATTTMRASIWSSRVTTQLVAGDTVTITLSASVAAKAATVSEFSGFVSPIAIDAQNGLANTAGTTTPNVTPGITTTNANDVLVSLLAVKGPDSDTFTEDTVTNLFLQTARIGTDNGGAANTNVTLNAAYRSVGATGTYNYQPTLGTGRDWIEFLIAYKAT